MLNVEFHCHTFASKDSLARPEDILRASLRKGIDRVVITDHNTLRGARDAVKLDPQHFIMGEEILTTGGELLAAYVQEEIPRGLPYMEVLKMLKEQGAFISVSHPFDATRNGHWELKDLEAILPYIDAVEVFNSRCTFADANDQALAFARQHGLPGTAGSDAHGVIELGRAFLSVPEFTDAASLRQAVRSGQVTGKITPWWNHFISIWARIRKNMA